MPILCPRGPFRTACLHFHPPTSCSSFKSRLVGHLHWEAFPDAPGSLLLCTLHPLRSSPWKHFPDQPCPPDRHGPASPFQPCGHSASESVSCSNGQAEWAGLPLPRQGHRATISPLPELPRPLLPPPRVHALPVQHPPAPPPSPGAPAAAGPSPACAGAMPPTCGWERVIRWESKARVRAPLHAPPPPSPRETDSKPARGRRDPSHKDHRPPPCPSYSLPL